MNKKSILRATLLEIKERLENERKMNNNDIIKELQGRGYEAESHEVIKNGVSMKGIIIRSNDPITPILYTDDLVKMAEECGQGISDVADVLVKKYEQQKDIEIDVNQLMSRETILSHIYIGIQKNSGEKIEKKPCEFEGLEKYLYVKHSTKGRHYSLKLSQQIMGAINLSSDEAWHYAEKNTFAVGETQVQNVASMLSGMGYISDEVAEAESDFQQLYVVTNRAKYRGASAILDRRALKAFAEEHGVNELIVLPSSIHEMLILPYQGDMNLDDLSDIVKEVNAAQVEPEEQLTDTAYLIKL